MLRLEIRVNIFDRNESSAGAARLNRDSRNKTAGPDDIVKITEKWLKKTFVCFEF